MGNFMRRTLAFFLGMIVAFVLVVGALVGGGYWAFKNLTPKDVGVKEETLGGLSSMTFEEWTAFIVDIKKDPQAFTVKELEKKGFNVNSFLTSVGVDVENANPKDIESFKELALGSMFGGGALQEVGMGVVFLFIPKNSETGKYPIFSEGARNRLRQFTLADFFGGATDNSGYSSVLRSMKLGSVLSSSYEEVLLPDGTFEYVSEDRGLNLLANVELGVLTDKRESGFDFGGEIQEGYLSTLKDKELIEIIASFGSKDEETFNAKYEGLAILSGVTLGETFVWSDEQGKYAFSAEPILNCLNIGKFMGVELCTKNDSCPVHESVLDCDGELYEGGVISTKPDLEKGLLKNLASISVVDIMSGGLDISAMLDGLYLGSAFGYKKCTGNESCPVHGKLDPYVNCEGSIGKWFDDSGKYVGKMFDKLSANSFVDALNGNLDIDGIINETKVGEIFGYVECSGDADCEVHDLFDCSAYLGNWYDSDGNPIERNDVTSKVMYQLYGKTLNDFGSLEIGDLLQGIKLGEFMGYVYNEDEGYWENSNGTRADILYETLADIEISNLTSNPNALTDELGKLYLGDFMKYEKSGDEWYDNGKVLSGIDKTLANIKLSDVLNGTLDIQEELSGIKIGEILGYTLTADGWVDESNNLLPKTEMIDKIFYQLYDKTLNNLDSLQMEDLMSGIKLGEFMGYVYSETNSRWEDTSGNPADVLYQTIAGIEITELMSNPSVLTDELGKLYLGDFMKYEKVGNEWRDNGVAVSGVDETLANIKLSDVLNGTLDIQSELNGIKIGEILGYTLTASGWVDEFNKPVQKTDTVDKIFYQLYDKTLNDLSGNGIKMEDLLVDVTLGEFLGLTFDSTDNRWEQSDGTKASLLYATIAGVNLSELISNPNLLNDKIGTLYVGDFMGYERDGETWKNGATVITGVDKIIANISLSDVLNGTLDIQTELNGVKIGEVMGLKFENGVWYDNGTAIDSTDITGKVFYSIYGKTLDGFGSLEIGDLLQGVKLGEFLGLKYNNSRWEDGSGNPASVLYTAIADIDVPALLQDGTLITKKLEKLYFGNFMGYELDGGVWKDGDTALSGVDKILAEICLGDVLNGTVDIKDSLKGVSIGDVMGLKFENGVWYDNGTAIDSTDITGKVFYGIYGRSISEFGSLEIGDLLQGIKLGEFLGLKYNNNRWEDSSGNPASVLYTAIADIDLPALLQDGTLITKKLETLYVGNFMGYEFNGTDWTNGGVALTGVDKLLAEICLGDVLNGTVSLDVNSLKLEDLIDPSGNKILTFLCSGGTTINGLNAKVNEMVLGDVVDAGDNTMLNLLKDTTLDGLSAKIDTLYIGEVMGFTRCTGANDCPVHGAVDCLATKNLWYEKSGENWVLEVGVEARVADLQITDMDEHGIKSLEFVMGDVLSHEELEHGLFALAHLGVIKDENGVVTNPNSYEDVDHIPMTEFAERVSIGAEEASYAELDHAGVMHLSTETTSKLDFVFDAKYGVGVWETWTIDKIFSEIVAFIPGGN